MSGKSDMGIKILALVSEIKKSNRNLSDWEKGFLGNILCHRKISAKQVRGLESIVAGKCGEPRNRFLSKEQVMVGKQGIGQNHKRGKLKRKRFFGEEASEMEQDTEQAVIIRARNQQEEERINLREVRK